MPKDLQFKATLTRWFSGQSKFPSLRHMATELGIPFNTLRGYFSGKCPRGGNLKRLAEATGLNLMPSTKLPPTIKSDISPGDRKQKIYAARVLEDLQFDLSRCLSSLSPAHELLVGGAGQPRGSIRRRAQSVQALMDALQRNIEDLMREPDALRQLRQTISGSDAGYLSGLLGAIFDDRRLQTWKEMTTYKYGSK